MNDSSEMQLVGRAMNRYEQLLAAQGFTRVAGADEAGRGALAGPLVAAAVILPDSFDIEGINDSKMLTEPQRETQYERIVAAAAWIACKAEPAAIDARGLHRSNIALLRRAAKALERRLQALIGLPVDHPIGGDEEVERLEAHRAVDQAALVEGSDRLADAVDQDVAVVDRGQALHRRRDLDEE